jgi:biopolymer transport protein TolQ
MANSIAAPVEGVAGADLAGTVATAATGGDLSMISLILHADPIVLCVMLGLIAMSLMSWAIIIDKFLALRSVGDKSNQFESEFWQAEALDKFYDKVKKRKSKHPLALMFISAMDEWFRSKGQERVVPGGSSSRAAGELNISLKERIIQMMAVTRNREIDRLERGLGFLATAGSASPFIGLFGTCIGIINAFADIAGSQNTSLAVVAPGIAEALFATAIGLFVAIPAVIAFNKFNGELNRLNNKLDDFMTEFQMLLSRQLDKGGF